MPAFDLTTTLIFIAAVVAFVLGTVAYLILAERKVAAWVQDRLGPNRVGPWGLLQPIVDGGKMFLKEEVIPAHVDRWFFLLAPMVAFGTALCAIAVVPFGATTAAPPPAASLQEFTELQARYQSTTNFVIAPGLDIGILYSFALGSLAVYGVILAGWSANNKYSLLGSLRSSAQIISYEIPLGMSIVGVLLFSGSLNLETIIERQGTVWNAFVQPLAFLLFVVSVFAECNRLPFDLPEAEQELVGGYHTEYSSLKLGMLLLAEYAHMITASFMMSVVFLGGWYFFGLENLGSGWSNYLIKLVILAGKMFGFIGLFLLVRWTIPRFRFDQLMSLAWKVMIPLSILHLLACMIVRQTDSPWWVLTIVSVSLFFAAGLWGALTGGQITAPRRRVAPLPAGLPEGVTYASR